MIRDIHQQPALFRLLVNSFSPGIFGHEVVKAGIMLALFGARIRSDTEKGSLRIRSDSHVLVVGDPGLGKSQMLTAVGQIAPRGVYVCGTSGISSSGLTVTLVKEAGSGDFALEAGALVLSDMGCCAIDEFDKVSSEHSSLLEAMEQQSISIAKGGLVCSLPARASVIAAANPAGGHYNKAKTVAENLKINGALLSRFDLIFILLDRPDADMDRFLSEHVMALHSGSSAAKEARFPLHEDTTQQCEGTMASAGGLEKWLRLKPGEKLDMIPPPLLRKYVAYARKYVQPRLSQEAKAKLQSFYLELRANHRAVDSTPITTRQLEALVRLAEARARAELRETVTASDAENVVEIMRCSLFQTYEDEDGLFDFGRSQMGTGVSRTSDIKR
ncbi:DNA replication licensing factor mcm8 [Linderina pennispora]|nr:DNA replication licensing factor mcm8 [Linderina pennispora]